MRPSLDELKSRLQGRFPADRIDLTDDSHLHAGHAGSSGGAGHYSVTIVSARFEGLTRLARHRLLQITVQRHNARDGGCFTRRQHPDLVALGNCARGNQPRKTAKI
jgi:BolA protein